MKTPNPDHKFNRINTISTKKKRKIGIDEVGNERKRNSIELPPKEKISSENSDSGEIASKDPKFRRKNSVQIPALRSAGDVKVSRDLGNEIRFFVSLKLKSDGQKPSEKPPVFSLNPQLLYH